MKIFVTGGAGFLGQHLIRQLSTERHEVIAPTSSECDLRDFNNLSNFPQKFDVIYHLAAYTQAGDWCLKHPGEQWIINQQINTNVLNWWFANQKQAKMVAMGTSCSYAPGQDLIETNYMSGEPIESLYTYAMTKRMLLQGLVALKKQYEMQYLYVVPSTLYGAGYHQDGRQMHFIFDLIRKILRGKEFGEEVILWGDGDQRREIVHVDDFLANLNSLLKSNKIEVYNLGSGEDYSIREFAILICSIVGYDFSKINFDTSRYVGAKSKVLNVSKAKEELGYFANRDLESGLRDVIDWFKTTKSYA